MPIWCVMGVVWPTPLGGSKMRPIASTSSSVPLGLTESVGESYEGRPPSRRASNSPAFAFVISVSPCSLLLKSAGTLPLSRHLCPDGKKDAPPCHLNQ